MVKKIMYSKKVLCESTFLIFLNMPYTRGYKAMPNYLTLKKEMIQYII
jgi:hypothetical protein